MLSFSDLRDAVLESAEMAGAYLNGARLQGANLENAKLYGAYVVGTDLREVRGLDQDQLETMVGDRETRLPAGLRRPVAWSQD
jgi:uncharacterized protein YjbI with pentapeptide repeats